MTYSVDVPGHTVAAKSPRITRSGRLQLHLSKNRKPAAGAAWCIVNSCNFDICVSFTIYVSVYCFCVSQLYNLRWMMNALLFCSSVDIMQLRVKLLNLPSTNKHFNSLRFPCGWVNSDQATICFNDEENLKKTCVPDKIVNRKASSGNLHAWQKCVNFQDAFDQLGRKNIGVRLLGVQKILYFGIKNSAQKQFNLVSPTLITRKPRIIT